jgi:hypothetical protein
MPVTKTGHETRRVFISKLPTVGDEDHQAHSTVGAGLRRRGTPWAPLRPGTRSAVRGGRRVATSAVLGAELGDLHAGVAGPAPNSCCCELTHSCASGRPGALLDVLGSRDCPRRSRAGGHETWLRRIRQPPGGGLKHRQPNMTGARHRSPGLLLLHARITSVPSACRRWRRPARWWSSAARQDLRRGWAVCLLTGAPQWPQRSRSGVFMVVP